MLGPLCFEPFLRPMVWGGRRLASKLGKHLPTDEPYGESWELSDHPLHRSVVANGPLAGTTLRALMETRREELLGPASKDATFPLLVKFLDANDWLSVQVHPDEDAVKKLWPGEGSKTEAWFVLDAAPGSRIYAGLLPGVGERELRAAIQAGTVAECLHSFQPQSGDCVFLPAGTVHAVGGGVLMAEVQQTSDATFRLFDWNRPSARKLHIEEGLASIHWDQGPITSVSLARSAKSVPKRQSLVHCRYFDLEFLHITEPQSHGGDGRATILLVLAGHGHLATGEGKCGLNPGQTWLLPACFSGELCPQKGLILLRCHLS